MLSIAMNDLEHVDELLYLYCWCGHRVRAQLLYSEMQTRDRRSDGHGQGHRQGWGCILNTPLFLAFI